MPTLALSAYVRSRTGLSFALRRVRASERGEGVISAAIAVLVMAFLGAAMWLAFKGMFAKTTKNTGDQVDQIGR